MIISREYSVVKNIKNCQVNEECINMSKKDNKINKVYWNLVILLHK